MPFLTDAFGQIFGALNELAQIILDSRILCLTCVAERQRAIAAGTPEHEAAPPNAANLVLTSQQGQAQSLCLAHVQFTDKPIVPGQTPSGLYVAGKLG